jgi:hypothetical protein
MKKLVMKGFGVYDSEECNGTSRKRSCELVIMYIEKFFQQEVSHDRGQRHARAGFGRPSFSRQDTPRDDGRSAQYTRIRVPETQPGTGRSRYAPDSRSRIDHSVAGSRDHAMPRPGFYFERRSYSSSKSGNETNTSYSFSTCFSYTADSSFETERQDERSSRRPPSTQDSRFNSARSNTNSCASGPPSASYGASPHSSGARQHEPFYAHNPQHSQSSPRHSNSSYSRYGSSSSHYSIPRRHYNCGPALGVIHPVITIPRPTLTIPPAAHLVTPIQTPSRISSRSRVSTKFLVSRVPRPQTISKRRTAH